MTNTHEENINKKAIKAGICFTICNFATRGISFITAPLFARMLTKEDYGNFANYSSWASLLTILATLDLYSSINNAKIDFKNDLNSYISSILVCGSVFTAICYIIVILFQNFFTQLFGLDVIYIHTIFITLIFAPALGIFQAKNNVELEYKKVVVITAISTVVAAILGLLFVYYMNDKYCGRVLGTFSHAMIIYLPIYAYILYKNHDIKMSYIKYALAISIPIIPHLLAGNILNSSDRLMIKHFCGAEPTALYSLIYTCSTAFTILMRSFNNAWVPWFFEKLKKEEYEEINKAHIPYMLLQALGSILIMLLGPEVVLFFGGEKYYQSIEIMPAIILGCFLMGAYTLYVNVEFYEKKTILISIMTIISAIFNFTTNYFFIPKYGYTAAAYTTLASYFLLFVLHYFACRQFKPQRYFSARKVFAIVFAMFPISYLSLISYENTLGRYLAVLTVLAIASWQLFTYRNYIKKNK